ncbi:S-adenosyl-L-methionine-dependent methyltransferase [Colletotrichum lupini]|nr:S-adenosyl-L-methionine-dependent methyltransferase [Colletotrichum lupini]
MSTTDQEQQPAANNGPVIIADDFSVASSSTSLASSILNHRIENGRTYHRYKDGQYSYPNDEKEADRLDLQHNVFLLTLDYRLGLAPIAQPEAKVGRVLDVGTGTGLWCVEFGDEHPDAEAVVSCAHVLSYSVPPNVKFEVDDLEEPWTYHTKFDYIHTRAMTSSISDWRRFFKQSYDFLEPGGYLELQEGHMRPECDDGTLKPDSPLVEWVDRLEEACNIFGRPFVDCPSLRPLLEEVGFEDVVDPHYRELGIWTLENMLEGLEAWSMAPFTRALEWTKEEVNVFLIGVRNELKNKNVHGYIAVYIIHARKPLKETEENREAS